MTNRPRPSRALRSHRRGQLPRARAGGCPPRSQPRVRQVPRRRWRMARGTSTRDIRWQWLRARRSSSCRIRLPPAPGGSLSAGLPLAPPPLRAWSALAPRRWHSGWPSAYHRWSWARRRAGIHACGSALHVAAAASAGRARATRRVDKLAVRRATRASFSRSDGHEMLSRGGGIEWVVCLCRGAGRGGSGCVVSALVGNKRRCV